MPRYHGKKGQVLIAGTAAAEASLAISLSQWTLDMSKDRVDVTSFGDGNRRFVQGFSNITGTLVGFFDDAENKIYTASDEDSGVKMYLYVSTVAPSKYWYGKSWVDYSIDNSATDAAKVNATFAADSDWGRN